MHEFMTITKALADKNRVRAVMFLDGVELSLCQIIEMLGLKPSTVSKHMSILVQAGLVETRKQGRWHFYKLPGKNSSTPSPPAPSSPPSLPVRLTLGWLQEALKGDKEIARDRKRLKSVLKIDREELCRHYKS